MTFLSLLTILFRVSASDGKTYKKSDACTDIVSDDIRADAAANNETGR